MLYEKDSNLKIATGFDRHKYWDVDLFNKKADIRLFRLHGSVNYIKDGDEYMNLRTGLNPISTDNHLIIYPGYKGNPSLFSTNRFKK